MNTRSGCGMAEGGFCCIGRQGNDVKARLVGRAAYGHREHNLFTHTGELPIAHDARAAITQEEPEKRGTARGTRD